MPVPRKQLEAEKATLDEFIVLADSILSSYKPNTVLSLDRAEQQVFSVAYSRLQREITRRAASGRGKIPEEEKQQRFEDRMNELQIYKLLDEDVRPRLTATRVQQLKDGLEIIREIRAKARRLSGHTKKASETVKEKYKTRDGWEEIAKVRAGNARKMVENRPETAPGEGGRKGGVTRKKTLNKKEREEIAHKGANARWKSKK